MTCKVIVTATKQEFTQEEFLDMLRRGEISFAPKPKVSAIQSIKDKIYNIINGKKFIVQYMGDDLNTLASKKPTQAELEEYENFVTNNNIHSPRYKQLRAKLNEFQILAGTKDSATNSSIADYLDLLAKLENEQEPTVQKDELDNRDFITLAQADESTERGGFDPSASVSSPDRVLVNNFKEGILEFSYISVDKFANFFPDHALMVLDKNKVEQPITPSTDLKAIGTTFVLKGVKDITLKIADKSRIQIDEKDFSQHSQGVKIMSGGVNGFRTVFTETDSVYSPMQSDFAFNNKVRNLEVNKITVNSLAKDEELRLVVDMNDEYNISLFKQYEAGKIDKDTLINQLNIYTYKGSNLVGNLTAIGANTNLTEEAEKNRALRELALLHVENSTESEINLPFKGVSVKNTLLGNPNVKMDENGNILEEPFTLTTVQNVVATGYILDGKMEGKNIPKDVITPYINSVSKKNQGIQVPFIVFNYGGKNIAYPISLTKQVSDHTDELQSIINSGLSNAQKAAKVIDLMQATKTKVDIDFTTPDWINSDELNSLSKKLEAVDSTVISTKELAEDGFNKNSLITAASISIDIQNEPFQASKILVNLPSIEANTPSEILEGKRIAKVNEIANIGRDFYNDFVNNRVNYEDKKGNVDEESDFAIAMDKIGDIKDSGVSESNYASNKGIVNALEFATAKINKKAKDSLGSEKWDNAKKAIADLKKIVDLEVKNKDLAKQMCK